MKVTGCPCVGLNLTNCFNEMVLVYSEAYSRFREGLLLFLEGNLHLPIQNPIQKSLTSIPPSKLFIFLYKTRNLV